MGVIEYLIHAWRGEGLGSCVILVVSAAGLSETHLLLSTAALTSVAVCQVIQEPVC